MRYYFAPMEGITGVLYRTVHHRCFPGVDKYFIPFLSPSKDHVFTKKDLRELDPARNQGLTTVPQLLTCRAVDFIWAAGELAQMGYREVNLNLGCPSGTVTAKGKGSGFLRSPKELDHFLEEVFSHVEVAVSIKTRVGFQSPEEFEGLWAVFRKYPIAELTIHPRVRTDFYKGSVRLDTFAQAAASPFCPLCYNGDLVSATDCWNIGERFPTVGAVMIGRGLVGDPALITKVRGGSGADKETLRNFHNALYDGYTQDFGSRRNAMLRMKEVWFYLIHLFSDSEKYAKRLKKAADTAAFESCVSDIFQELELLELSAAGWRS